MAEAAQVVEAEGPLAGVDLPEDAVLLAAEEVDVVDVTAGVAVVVDVADVTVDVEDVVE